MSGTPGGDGRTTVRAPGRGLVDVHREGARLTIVAHAGALTEMEARTVSRAGLASGERLVACVGREGAGPESPRFTFVVWPRTRAHTGSILTELRHAA